MGNIGFLVVEQSDGRNVEWGNGCTSASLAARNKIIHIIDDRRRVAWDCEQKKDPDRTSGTSSNEV